MEYSVLCDLEECLIELRNWLAISKAELGDQWSLADAQWARCMSIVEEMLNAYPPEVHGVTWLGPSDSVAVLVAGSAVSDDERSHSG